MGPGGVGCLVDLEGTQAVVVWGRGATDALQRRHRPIKKRTRPGPLDDQITFYELL
jgi:hypothetical protein